MFRGSRSRARIAVLLAVGALVPVVGASPAHAAGPSFVGPLVSNAESGTTSWGRDGGMTVPLPNGRDLWLFGDTPRYQWVGGHWKLNAFIYGSSAGLVPYTRGHAPGKAFNEIVVGHSTKSSNQPHQFLPTPKLYMPNGSGKACNTKNGGPTTGADRWATGGVLLPDKRHVLIPYLGVCVISASNYRVEAWGFVLYDWRTNKFSSGPYDVFPASKKGTAVPLYAQFRSPVIDGGKVAFFSAYGTKMYTTSVSPSISALRNQSSYKPKEVAGLKASVVWSIVSKSKTQNHLTMYQMKNTKGQYTLLKAPKPSGPWTKLGSGTLPRCSNAPSKCNSFALHPELSTSSKMLVSYYLPGFGPGLPKKHPYPHSPLGHVVTAWLPA
jgi:hypothetical protein